jgi:hypothetical protein
MSARAGRSLLLLLWLDAVILAVIEVFFLPLRLDGWLLPRLGSVPLPVTALIAAVATPWLVLTAARISPRAAVAASPLLIWLAAVLGLWFNTPGGVTVLLPDWRSLLLVGAGGLPAAVVLGGVLGRRAPRAGTDNPASAGKQAGPSNPSKQAGTSNQDKPGSHG